MNFRRSIAAWSSWNEYLLAAALVVAALSGMLAAGVVGTAIHSYRTFVIQTGMKNPWWLPLWPQHFNSTGTKVLIGSGSAILLLNIIFIGYSIVPKFNQSGRSCVATLTGVFLSFASLILALFSVVLITILNKRSPNSDTIQTWTCKFSSNAPTLSTVTQSVDLTNEKFQLLCSESKFGFYGMISIIGMEFLLALLVAARWFTDKPAVPSRYEGYPVRGAKIEDDGFSF